MLDIYIHDGPSELRFVLGGALRNGDCRQLEGAWATALSIATGKNLVIDASRLETRDEDGEALLARLRAEGATVREGAPAGRPARRGLLSRWLCRQTA